METVEQKLERQIDELIKQNAALAAENETLNAYKEAAEKQESVGAVIKDKISIAAALNGNGYSLLKSGDKLYAKPVPADRQEVAVPEGWKLVPNEVDRNTALSMIMEAAKANGLSTEHKPTEQEIENSWKFANAVLASAPEFKGA